MTLFVFTLLMEWLGGLGILAATNTRLPRSIVIPVSLLAGMFVHCMHFFCIDLIHFGFSPTTVATTALVAAVLPHVWIGRVRRFYAWLFVKPKFSLRMYDVVALGYAVSVGYYVVWAAWYWPVTPFDAMAGIDLVAREAVNQGTINNRVFTDPSLAGFLSNQPFYAPFAMLMQVMYRIMGFAYGQVWLGILAVVTSWSLWTLLRQFTHPVLANVLWMLLILTPELLGYTYLLQTDYINAAYLTTGVLVLAVALQRSEYQAWGLSALLLAGACWSRTETILLVALGLVASLIVWKKTALQGQKLYYLLGTGAIGTACFALWNWIYLRSYLPVHPDTASQITGFDLSKFVDVTSATLNNVVADTGLWGIAFILFGLAFLANVVVKKSLGNTFILGWIVAVFLGLLVVGTIFSAAVVEQTLRRGIFKLLPLMFVYVAALPIVQAFSNRLDTWERGAR